MENSCSKGFRRKIRTKISLIFIQYGKFCYTILNVSVKTLKIISLSKILLLKSCLLQFFN